jgi:peptidoglycan biosynthesis protein MviN/MurJ (putative lipid II flippase)
MLFPLSGVVLPGFLIALFSAWTLTQGKQRNTLLEAVPACTILGMLLLPGLPDSTPLVAGTVLGFLLQTVFLAYPLWKDRLLDGIRLSFTSPVWKDFNNNFGLLLIGQIAFGIASALDLIVCARLGQGDLSIFNYSGRLLGLLFSFGSIAISRAVLPVFSLLQNNPREMLALVARWAWITGVSGGVLAATLWPFAPWVVSFLFERGAFDAAASDAVASVFRYGLLQLPFYFIWNILVSYLSAQQMYKTLSLAFVANIPVKICAFFVFVPWIGVGGVYLSACIMYLFSILFILYLNKSLKERLFHGVKK